MGIYVIMVDSCVLQYLKSFFPFSSVHLFETVRYLGM